MAGRKLGGKNKTHITRLKYNSIPSSKRSKKKKKLIIQGAKSGGCILCGYKKCLAALDFHHVSSDKEFSVNKACANSYSYDCIIKEIGKCVVVCSNCHREIHAGEIVSYPHVVKKGATDNRSIKETKQLSLVM